LQHCEKDSYPFIHYDFYFSYTFLIQSADSAAATSKYLAEDTSEINKLLTQGYNFAVNGYMDQAMPLALSAQLIAKKTIYLPGICKGMNLQSYILIRQGNYDSSLIILKKALIIGRTLKDSSLQSTSMLYLANAYSNKGNHSTAIEFITRD
jgi:tetratricopeptide (TPR) repeat protein